MGWGNRDESEESTDDTERSTRRTFLRTAGASAAALAGASLSPAVVTAQDGGPPGGNWSLTFEDQFESGELDDSKWDVGWGWGKQSTMSKTVMTEENVSIKDEQLCLIGTHDGNAIRSGAVNTRETKTFGPGTYVEARLKFADRVGFHPAFWAKPTRYSWWPPEIDVIEVLQNGSGEDDTHISRHFLHYSQSTQPGDASTRNRLKVHSRPGDDLTKNFHVYGAEWQSNGIAFYVDGQAVGRFTDGTMLQAMQKGAPFYLNLDQNIYINSPISRWVGSADLSESWGEETLVDWVRVWEQ